MKFGNAIVKPNKVKEFVINRDKDYLEEIERLNNIINDINYYIEQRCNEDIDDTEKAILHSIELISKGIIKVAKEN